MHTVSRIAGAIILTASPLAAQTPNATLADKTSPVDPQTRALAVQVVAKGGERDRLAGALAPVEDLLKFKIKSALGLTDEADSAKIMAIVHAAVIVVSSKVSEAEADAYAANFSTSELSEILAFLTGPSGEAEETNLPLLKRDLRAALDMDTLGVAKIKKTAALDLDKVSPNRRDSIERIFKAQDLEAHTRQGYLTLQARLSRVTSIFHDKPITQTQNSSAKSNEEARAADDYANMVMAVETQFYATHYTDTELAGVADYLESKAGRAALTRKPLIQQAAGRAMRAQFTTFLAALDASVCSAVACTPTQHASLRNEIDSLSGMLTQIPPASS